MKIAKIIIVGILLLYILFCVYQFIYYPNLPISFNNEEHQKFFISTLIYFLPATFLILLLLKLKNKKLKMVFGLIIPFSIGLFVYLAYFSTFWSAWVDTKLLYQSKQFSQITIVEQILDKGALGYGGKRVVRKEKINIIFSFIDLIDTTNSRFEKNKWIVLNKDLGNFIYP